MKCISAGPVKKEKEKSGPGATELEVSRDTTDLGLNIDCSDDNLSSCLSFFLKIVDV